MKQGQWTRRDIENLKREGTKKRQEIKGKIKKWLGTGQTGEILKSSDSELKLRNRKEI